jgi:uncharacterized protein YpmS
VRTLQGGQPRHQGRPTIMIWKLVLYHLLTILVIMNEMALVVVVVIFQSQEDGDDKQEVDGDRY